MPICDCGQNFYSQNKLEEHQKTNCTKWHLCALCNETVLSSDKITHLNLCGSKTIQCVKCSKYVLRGEYNYHLENTCSHLHKDDTFNKSHSIEVKDTKDNDDDDDVLIPCENCFEQIKWSSFKSHMTNCERNIEPFSWDVFIDHSTSEKNIQTRSTRNKSFNSNTFDNPTQSTEDQSDLINSSFRRMSLNSNKNASNNADNNYKENAASIIHKKTEDVCVTLSQEYYESEIKHATKKLQFNIILMGSPRVGKSELINALCGGLNLAKTSSSLNSCTKKIEQYILEDNQQRTPGVEPFCIYFYDTPGIESWINQNGQETMLKFIEEKDPVCFIYCASPGSFADLKQLQPILYLCQTKNIFCALVCTNMWANPNRKMVIREFEKELAFFGKRVEKIFDQGHYDRPHQVILFGDGALCTMVNSLEYYDPDVSDKRQPVQGVDELIHCVMEKLDHEKVLGWCNAVLYRRSYWEKISQKITGFYSEDMPKIAYSMSSDQIAIDFATRFFQKFINRK